jgi:two-component system invasion response regulator UvrY
MVKLGFVDDHRLFRKGLISLVTLSLPDVQIILEADDGFALQNLIDPKLLPDIILMDIHMPNINGYDAVKWLTDHYPDIKILVVSMVEDENSILTMVKGGVKGYLTKGADQREIVTAIQTIYDGGFYYTDFLTGKLVHALQNSQSLKSGSQILLNERELEFLQYVCSDETYNEIAKKMFLSPKTIDGYRDALFEKLQVRSRVGLAIYAIKNGHVNL